MTSTTTATMVDGVNIVVPDSLDLITPYVLREQNDWFEDEIKFLRILLKPGDRVIDIGANYGVFTLSMAQSVGANGCVWAFEPSPETAELLTQSVAANGFEHVAVIRSAISNTCGTAELSSNQHAELNTLVRDRSSAGKSQTVAVSTLDALMRVHQWREIDFVKIDIEGEEGNILQRGSDFLSSLSPLIQYEVKAGKQLHLRLIQDFAAHGYISYRLVPGLNLLIPFESGTKPDDYLLNLFCCKPDRAERLANAGFLLNNKGYLSDAWQPPNEYQWSSTIATHPYSQLLMHTWEHSCAQDIDTELDHAIALYNYSQALQRTPAIRFSALERSYQILAMLATKKATHPRLASLARVSQDYGARMVAVNALSSLSTAILQSNQADVSRPFLSPSKRFDSVSPGLAIGNWLLAAALEELEKLSSFSSFYTGPSAIQRLELIQSLGFGGEEMSRRLRMVRERFSQAM